jgi:hypothetical protein
MFCPVDFFLLLGFSNKFDVRTSELSPVLPKRRNLRSFLFCVRSFVCKHMRMSLLPS